MGGLALMAGFRTKLAASLLALFLIAATIVFHIDFVTEEDWIQTLKNLAILGGLIAFGAVGAGPLSVDARRK